MTGALPLPGYDPYMDESMDGGEMAPVAPGMGALPMPGGMSPATRDILMAQIKRLSEPSQREESIWSKPAFLAGLTLLGGGNLGQAGMAAAQAGQRAEASRELNETRRASSLASLTGQLARADQSEAAKTAAAKKAQADAMKAALGIVPANKRGQLTALMRENGTDATDLGAVYDLVTQNNLPLMPSYKPVAGVGLVDEAAEGGPKVVIPVQRAPTPPSETERLLVAAGLKSGTPEYQAQARLLLGKKSGEGSGPFAGTAMDAQSWNIISAPNADRSSPAYIAAYTHLSQPKLQNVPDKDGNMVMAAVTPTIPFAPPILPGQAPPPAPSAGAPPASAQPPAGAPPVASSQGGFSVQPMGGPPVDKTAKAKLDSSIANAATLTNALTDYAKAFEVAGPGERVRSVAGTSTPLNTAYNQAALLAKGEELYNLGVLNGPDLDIIRRTLPDPSTIKGQFSGAKEAKAAVEAVQRLLQDRLNALLKQQGKPPIDLIKYGAGLRTPDGAAGATDFGRMSAGDLLKIDPKTLKGEALAQWRAAADKFQ